MRSLLLLGVLFAVVTIFFFPFEAHANKLVPKEGRKEKIGHHVLVNAHSGRKLEGENKQTAENGGGDSGDNEDGDSGDGDGNEDGGNEDGASDGSENGDGESDGSENGGNEDGESGSGNGGNEDGENGGSGDSAEGGDNGGGNEDGDSAEGGDNGGGNEDGENGDNGDSAAGGDNEGNEDGGDEDDGGDEVKHLLGADNKKVGAVRDTWDIPLKPPADKLGNRDLLDEVVRSRTSLPFEKQRDVGIPLQSSSCLHKSRNEDRTGRCAHRPNIRNPVVESRAIKR
ncbi:uncharacterized protein DDB_G0290685-like [Prunus dulcis]|uniref:uncharacterized protein DDB_G0290685-like n=1 Tax=Prunus dulcis TaxID=3755 RepID=UPI001482CE62|nr:uncharacterized protein DDB_G0290685-like [Prunus dulcis]